jgi:hypothetical protein
VSVTERATSAQAPGTASGHLTPLTGGSKPFIYTTSFDLASVGYIEAEYVLAGSACAYARTRRGVTAAEQADYATRVLIYRPADDDAFNGTIWVEWLNVSGGGQVDTTADENLSFRDSGGATRLVLLQADFKMSPSTVQGLVNLAKSGETDIDLITTIVPLIAGLAGIVLLVTGAILVSRRRPGGDAGPEPVDADQQEQVPVKERGVT